MSKLAALAARRRQKEANSVPSVAQPETEQPKDDYAASLSKLSLNKDTAGTRAKRVAVPEKQVEPIVDKPTENTAIDDKLPIEPEKIEDDTIASRVKPSAFADTFLINSTSPLPAVLESNFFTSGTQAFDFKDPSPDDIVYSAQTGRKRQ